MPYRRRRRLYKPRRFRRRGRLNTRKVRAIARREVYKNVEKKYHIDVNSNQAAGTTATFTKIFKPARGTGDSDRIGDEVNITSIYLGLTLDRHSAPTTVSEHVRMLIFEWKDPSSTPTLATLLQSLAYAVTSTWNHDFRKSYRIIWDQTFTLDKNKESYRVGRFLTKKPFRYNFNASSTDGADSQLYFCYFSDNSTENPIVDQYFIRFNYRG